MKRAWAAVTCAVTMLLGAGTASPQEAAPPALAYWQLNPEGTGFRVVMSDARGDEIRAFPDHEEFSFDGDVFAGEIELDGNRRVVGRSIGTGERLYRIKNAAAPVVTADGNKVFFLPSGPRDGHTFQTVWMRTRTGRIRKIIQFSLARGLPGVPHDITEGGIPLDVSLDQRGRIMAVEYGIETDTFQKRDVWLVDTRTKEWARLTRGKRSNEPAVSPNGSSVAVRTASKTDCGWYQAGKIRVFSTEDGTGTTVVSATCELFYDVPAWVDEDTLLATRVTKVGPDSGMEDFNLDIVSIDVATGEMTDLHTSGNPCCPTTSPDLGLAAWTYNDRDGATIMDIGTGQTFDLPPGSLLPHLSGEAHQ